MNYTLLVKKCQGKLKIKEFFIFCHLLAGIGYGCRAGYPGYEWLLKNYFFYHSKNRFFFSLPIGFQWSFLFSWTVLLPWKRWTGWNRLISLISGRIPGNRSGMTEIPQTTWSGIDGVFRTKIDTASAFNTLFLQDFCPIKSTVQCILINTNPR